MKRTRKAISGLAILALSTSMLVPAMPAAAVTSNNITKLPSIENDYKGYLTTVTIKEDGNGHQDFQNGDSFVVTLPSGVKFANYVDSEYVAVAKDTDVATVTDKNGSKMLGGSMATANELAGTFSNDRTLTLTFTGNGSAKEDDTVQLNLAVIVDGADGDINLAIDSLDSGVSGGEILIGRVIDGGTLATVLNTESIGDADNQKCGIVRLTENTAGNFAAGDEIQFTLNDGFTFNETSFDNISLLGGFNGLNAADFNPTLNTDKDELTLTFPDAYEAGSTRGIVELTPFVNVKSDANLGTVSVDISGDADSATLDIGTYGTYGTTVTANSVEEVVAGNDEVDLGSLVFEESVAGSLTEGRKITLELPDYAKFTKDEVVIESTSGDKVWTENFTVDSNDRHKATLTINRNNIASSNASKFKVKLEDINTPVNKTGDINVKVYSSSGMETKEVLVGKLIAPVTATVEGVKDVQLGVQAQSTGDIIIKETQKGTLMEDGTLLINLPEDGVKFSSTPKVEVTAGNVSLGTITTADSNHTVSIKIDNDSTQASTIKISGIKFNVDRTVSEGNIEVKVKGSALTDTNDGIGSDDTAMFDATTVCSVYPASVMNAAPSAGSATFNINSSIYNVNGVAKVMDSAPYIKADRTYVPVRYLAYALGVTENNISYDATAKMVTLVKGDKTVKLNIGDKNISVNDQLQAMDVAPEINKGRTMLPARFVAEAFGAQVGYDNHQVVISF